MPAAAVIPAPIAYIKVVAVKKLVVEPWNGAEGGFTPSPGPSDAGPPPTGEHWFARSLLPDARSCS